MPAANYGDHGLIEAQDWADAAAKHSGDVYEVLETQPGCYLSVKRGLSRRDGTKVKYTAMPEAK